MPVDGFEPISKTVFQYHGCAFHDCLRCDPEDRDEPFPNAEGDSSNVRLSKTVARTEKFCAAGYEVVEM